MLLFVSFSPLVKLTLKQIYSCKTLTCFAKERSFNHSVHFTIWTQNKHHVNSLWCCDLIWHMQDFPILRLIESPNNKCSVRSFLRWHQIPKETIQLWSTANLIWSGHSTDPPIALLVILLSHTHTHTHCVVYQKLPLDIILSPTIFHLGHILHFPHLDDHLTILLFISVPYFASQGSLRRGQKPLKVYYKNIIDLWGATVERPRTVF